MKRTALITAATLLLLAVTVTNATAQNDTATALNATTATDSVSTQRTDTGTVVVKPKAWFSFLTEIRMGTDMLDYPEFMTFDWNISPGVSFRNGLSIRVPVEYVIGMTKEGYNGNEGYYTSNGTVGLNLGYDFLNKSDRWRLELNASGGSTYLKTSYRFAYADLNLKFGTKYLGAYNAYLSIGLRYISPYNPDMTQKLMFNFSIGFFAF